MTVGSITWMARRASPADLQQARDMASAMGMDVLVSSDAQVTLQTARGDVVEFCGPAHPVPDYLFDSGETVIGFEVDDLESAADALAQRGMRALAPTSEGHGVRFCHFTGPGGAVYGLIQKV